MTYQIDINLQANEKLQTTNVSYMIFIKMKEHLWWVVKKYQTVPIFQFNGMHFRRGKSPKNNTLQAEFKWGRKTRKAFKVYSFFKEQKF